MVERASGDWRIKGRKGPDCLHDRSGAQSLLVEQQSPDGRMKVKNRQFSRDTADQIGRCASVLSKFRATFWLMDDGFSHNVAFRAVTVYLKEAAKAVRAKWPN